MALKPLSELPETPLSIRRALISVTDKSGVVEFAQTLVDQGIELLSTGGTAQALKAAGLPVTDVSDLTKFQECLDGRVKTLHPVIHGGILARTSYEPDIKELENLDIKPIELVVVNLYPFKETISKPECTLAIATENIDIGGPTMIRAAAKNFAHVAVATSPGQYQSIVDELIKEHTISYKTRLSLAKEAFNHTATYETTIASYFNSLDKKTIPEFLHISSPVGPELRYAENPHQSGAVYGDQNEFIDCFHGKTLSYNNFLDVDAALQIMSDFVDEEPTCAIIKHTIPSGVACGESLKDAYEKAFSTDPVSPFGGIVIVNRMLDEEAARAIDEIFTEIIIAPDFSQDAQNLLMQKKNRRLIRVKKWKGDSKQLQIRSIFGGYLAQEENVHTLQPESIQITTQRKPSEDELKDLLFAWKVVKHVKSNAVVYVKDGKTVGIGSGQSSRVDSSEFAVSRAEKHANDLRGCVVASDAFFPFPDGVEAAAKVGATALIQPGGSVRDSEVIEVADSFKMAMVFTGTRYFKH